MTPQDQLDIRDLALIIARSHDLPLDYVVSADEVSENDDEFLTAICASADAAYERVGVEAIGAACTTLAELKGEQDANEV